MQWPTVADVAVRVTCRVEDAPAVKAAFEALIAGRPVPAGVRPVVQRERSQGVKITKHRPARRWMMAGLGLSPTVE